MMESAQLTGHSRWFDSSAIHNLGLILGMGRINFRDCAGIQLSEAVHLPTHGTWLDHPLQIWGLEKGAIVSVEGEEMTPTTSGAPIETQLFASKSLPVSEPSHARSTVCHTVSIATPLRWKKKGNIMEYQAPPHTTTYSVS